MSRWGFLLLALIATLVSACAPSPTPLTPSEDTSLEAGEYHFTEVVIPEGTTLALSGDVVLFVEGAVSIQGAISGDCAALEIRGKSEIRVDGLIDNTCSDAASEGAGVRLIADGDITLGGAPAGDEVVITDGELFIADSTSENIELTPLLSGEAGELPHISVARLAIPVKQAGTLTKINRPVHAGAGATISRESTEVNADINAGNGKDAPGKGPIAGTCNNDAIGGNGGSIRLYSRGGTLSIGAGVTLAAGDGGKGGSCFATGNPAVSSAGRGGDGGTVLLGGQVIEFGAGVSLERGDGGPGGDADAIGDDGQAACEAGGDADATGGWGGEAGGIGYLIQEPGRLDGVPSVKGANGGRGGDAFAFAGDGQDCDACPGGEGGRGGVANAFGGHGGNGASREISDFISAPDTHLKGSGGNATATGGTAGNGATCCNPPMQAGDGGDGGDASATGGLIGEIGIGGGGLRGSSGEFAGDGLDGGDGDGPGLGGFEGIGTGEPDPVLDGFPGLDGGFCPVTAIGGIYVVNIFIILDGAGHGPFIGMPNVIELQVIIKLEEGRISIFGPEPWVELHGSIDDDGNFVATGIGVVAGFPGIDVALEGVIDPQALSGEMTMGGNGGLPQGVGITYSLDGENTAAGGEGQTFSQSEVALVKDFVEALQMAFTIPDPEFLYDSLHPAVIDRYGEEACRMRVENFGSELNLQFVKLIGFGPWDYMSDGLSTTIPDTYTVALNQTVDRVRQRSEAHFTLFLPEAKGVPNLTWFIDCGDP